VLGRKVSMGEAWRLASPRLPALLGLTLLTFVIIAAPVGVVIVLVLVLATVSLGGALAAGVLCGIAAFVVVLWLAVKLSLAPSAVVLERQGVGGALRRSWQLTRGSWWRLFGIYLLTGLIVGFAAVVLAIPFAIIAVVVGPTTVAAVIIVAVGGVIAGAATRPVSAGVDVLLYLDMRMRKEGLDLALQNAAAGQHMSGDELETVWRPPAPGTMPPAMPSW
jgi:hypothetical protein